MRKLRLVEEQNADLNSPPNLENLKHESFFKNSYPISYLILDKNINCKPFLDFFKISSCEFDSKQFLYSSTLTHYSCNKDLITLGIFLQFLIGKKLVQSANLIVFNHLNYEMTKAITQNQTELYSSILASVDYKEKSIVLDSHALEILNKFEVIQSNNQIIPYETFNFTKKHIKPLGNKAG